MDNDRFYRRQGCFLNAHFSSHENINLKHFFVLGISKIIGKTQSFENIIQNQIFYFVPISCDILRYYVGTLTISYNLI